MMSSVHLGLVVTFGFSLCFVRVVYGDGEVQPQLHCSNVPVAHEGRPVNFTVDFPATVNQYDNYNFNVRVNFTVVPVVSCHVGPTKDPYKGDNPPCTVDEGYAISGIRHPRLVFTVLSPKKKDAGNYTFSLRFYHQEHPFTATCGLVEVHAGNTPSSDKPRHGTSQAITDTTNVFWTTTDPGKADDASALPVVTAVCVTVVVMVALFALLVFCFRKRQRLQEFLQWYQRWRQQIQVPDGERGDDHTVRPTSRIDGDGSVDTQTLRTPLQRHQPIPRDPKQENGDAQAIEPMCQTGANASTSNASSLSSRRTADGQSSDEDYQKKTACQPGAQALLPANDDEEDDAEDDFEMVDFDMLGSVEEN